MRKHGGRAEERTALVAATLLIGALAAAAAVSSQPAYGLQTGGGAAGAGTAAGSQGRTPAGSPSAPGQSGTAGQANPTSPTSPTGTTAAPAPNGGGATAGTQSVPLPDGRSPSYDLARTVNEALASSAQVQIQRKQVEIDAKRVDEAEAQNRPSITGNASATRFDAKTKVSIAGSPPVQVIGDHTETLSLNATERLDLLGQVRAARSQARLQQIADRAALDTSTQERTLQAKTIYFNLLRAQHQVQVAETALRDAATQEAVSRRLYENQVGQKIDLLRAETNTAQAQQNLTAAQNSLDIARASFNDLVGRPLEAPVTVQDVPGVSVGVDIQAGTGAGLGNTPGQTLPTFTPFTVPPAEINGIDVNQSIAQAQSRRPEVLQNAALARAAEVGVRIAREGMEPSFALSASGDYYPTTSFQFPRQKTAAFTVSASIPLYDGGRTRDLVQEAHLRTDQARTALESSKSDVALQVRQSYLNLATAARQIDAANAALTQAIAARQLAEIRYEGQVGLFLEVTDAQAALVRAENSQVDAVYNYEIARAQFENAQGVPALQQTNTVVVSPSATPAAAAPAPATTPTTTPPPAAPPTTGNTK